MKKRQKEVRRSSSSTRLSPISYFYSCSMFKWPFSLFFSLAFASLCASFILYFSSSSSFFSFHVSPCEFGCIPHVQFLVLLSLCLFLQFDIRSYRVVSLQHFNLFLSLLAFVSKRSKMSVSRYFGCDCNSKKKI